MDPFAHTFTGAALAASGLRKTTPLATAALLIGVNAPDIDILVSYSGEYMSLAHRRGWTHGVLAWVVLPMVLTSLLLAWDKLVRLKRNPTAEPATATTLLLLSALAVLSHPAMDWLNNYGIRLLMPFDGRWFYGDALFIVDPWVWLLAGGACFLFWSRDGSSLLGWCLFWFAASWLITTNDFATDIARMLWGLGLLALAFCRFVLPVAATPRTAQVALIIMTAYMSANAIASNRAEALVREWMTANDFGAVETVMVGPVPANPFEGTVVAVTADAYVLGRWHWLKDQRLVLDKDTIPRNLNTAIVSAAGEDTLAQRFLIWSRFPYAEVKSHAGGYSVSFSDARYARLRGGIGGPTVELDRNLALRR